MRNAIKAPLECIEAQGEKSLEWIDSRGQTDIYDDPIIVERAVDMLAQGSFKALLR